MPSNSQLSFAGFSEEPAEWAPLMRALDGLGPEELGTRAAAARRALREQGAACHVPGGTPDSPGGIDRPWELDILPLVIAAPEWARLEAGLTQRARLLNSLLADLHGSQHTLRDGWLPAPLLYANPNYLRACQAVRVPHGCYLPMYAVDLARSQDGQWWVLADRTQNPAGLGFALENRALVSRVLPEAAQAFQPRSLDGALPLLQETLTRLTPSRENASPTVVVLTPGPRNEAYFEHTFLARKLCCTLAEGADLTVRDRRVYLKTLEGLRPVDVILRRVNDAFCDPLEFRGDSLLGVPGLLEAVRSGNVAMANALGSGLVESPAFLAFLPGLCRRLLDEELALPSVATWWCGGGRELRVVLSQIGRLAVRSAWNMASPPEQSDAVSTLENRLQGFSHEYVGQEEVHLSRIPAIRADGRRSMEPFYFRAFLIGDGTNYTLLPGGLVRLPGRERLTSGVYPLSQPTKDVWVAPDPAQPKPAPVSEASLATETARDQPPIDLPSRVADNLFWLGRYAERVENLARISRCVLTWAQETGASTRCEALAGMCWRMGVQSPGQAALSDFVGRIHLAAFAVRDRLSADTWRLLNRLPSRCEQIPAAPMEAVEVLNTLMLDLAAFSGMETENMTRGHGWLFLDFGRRLERASNLLSLIQSVTDAPEGADLLYEPMLEICDSVITFRRRYFAAIRLPDALDLLLFQRDNPRSLAFQIEALEHAARTLPEETNQTGVARIRWQMTALAAKVHTTRLEATPDGLALDGKPLRETLLSLSGQLRKVSDLLTQTFFSHSVPRVS